MTKHTACRGWQKCQGTQRPDCPVPLKHTSRFRAGIRQRARQLRTIREGVTRRRPPSVEQIPRDLFFGKTSRADEFRRVRSVQVLRVLIVAESRNNVGRILRIGQFEMAQLQLLNAKRRLAE